MVTPSQHDCLPDWFHPPKGYLDVLFKFAACYLRRPVCACHTWFTELKNQHARQQGEEISVSMC